MTSVIGSEASARAAQGVRPVETVKVRAGARLLFVDNLRVLLVSLVILVHLMITYGGPAGDWYYSEPGEVGVPVGAAMLLFLAVSQSFFMGLLFFFAAYLTPGSYERKGARVFVVDRLKRLGIPLAVYAFVVHPLTEYASALGEGWYHGSLLRFIRLGYAPPGPGLAWFIEALLLFTIAYVAYRRLATPRGAVTAPRAAPAPGNRALVAFALGLASVSFVVRLWSPVGQWFEPLHLQLGHFPQYIALFVAGIVAYRRDWPTTLTAAQARPWRWVVLVLAPLFVVLALATYFATGGIDAVMGGAHWQALAYAVWEQLMGVGMSVTLIVWFRERLNRQGAVARALSGATYATYLLHAPTIVLLGVALRGITMDLALKFVLVAPVALALSFVVGHLARRLPLAREVL